MKSGLVLVEIQNDHFPGGNMELASMNAAAQTASMVRGSFRQEKDPVYRIQHVCVRPSATVFIPGTDGMETHANVAPTGGDA